MLVDAVLARLADCVPALSGRLQLADDLTLLVAKQALPPSPVFGFVLPLALSPTGPAANSAGDFRQPVAESVAVLLGVNRAGDPAGAKALPRIDELVAAAIAAVCGWQPADDDASPFLNTGDFELGASQLLPPEPGGGVSFYQLQFVLPRQVRILA